MLPILYADFIADRQEYIHFEAIYRQYRQQMYHVARRVLHDDMEAEDAVQDAFIGIARNMKTVAAIQRESDRRNYVLQAAHNAAVSRARKEKSQPELMEPDALERIPASDFWERLSQAEDYRWVVAAIRGLPEIYGDVLWLHYGLELTMEQTAASLDIKLSTARQRLIRGRKRLLQNLEREGALKHGADKSGNE